ncbi:MAG: CDP-alcohol phosphatidyltransferase family protein [Actinomycetota bacterium]|jgi:archaetidylinositol phosphate synthase|nr:CDP-alcohol phosphatidyltransferase family protein [Actinomycetota bacterium]
MADINSHKRVNEPILGFLERPALQWLAARMPAWVTPDVLTGIGVAGAALIFASYWASQVYPWFLWVASFGFVINWFGDSLDGTLARFRKIERPKYGFYIDHTMDVIAEAFVFLGLGMTPFMRFDVAAMIYVGYLMMSVLVYIRTAVEGVFKITYSGFGPTELRVVAVSLNAVMFFVGAGTEFEAFGSEFSYYDVAGIMIAATLIGAFLAQTFAHARLLSNIDDKNKVSA